MLPITWRQRHFNTGVSRPFLAHFSRFFRRFSLFLTVLAPGSQKARKNGEKTAKNGKKGKISITDLFLGSDVVHFRGLGDMESETN